MTDDYGQHEQDDLFGTPEENGSSAPAPETLPLIPSSGTPAPASVPENEIVMPSPLAETRKAPLMFSERAPVPTRDGGETGGTDRGRVRTEEIRKHDFVPLAFEKIPQGATCGEILTLARDASGYSRDQVAGITRIHSQYLDALENDDDKRLPPAVYVAAYLRVLIGLYRLTPDTAALLDQYRRAHTSANEIPAELLGKISAGAQSNADEEKRINRIFIIVGAALAVAILLGVWAIAAALMSGSGSGGETDSKPETETAEPFDSAELEQLIAPVIPRLDTLEMSKNPSVKR